MQVTMLANMSTASGVDVCQEQGDALTAVL
jgi:hypothetical protein